MLYTKTLFCSVGAIVVERFFLFIELTKTLGGTGSRVRVDFELPRWGTRKISILGPTFHAPFRAQRRGHLFGNLEVFEISTENKQHPAHIAPMPVEEIQYCNERGLADQQGTTMIHEEIKKRHQRGLFVGWTLLFFKKELDVFLTAGAALSATSENTCQRHRSFYLAFLILFINSATRT